MANIEIEFESDEDAIQVMESINPDNSPLPQGMEIHTEVRDARLIVRIRCNRGIDSLRSTIEDIMSAIDLSVRTLDLV